ncbi:hypothetical protein ACHAW5_010806 [Stephanodiscus triporus]|uniref:OTU domain-containing protein n=1 Tax=Stephanodiscus triporus TaxID=2934178 RepID=A0ABD3NQH9_9STRA
MSSSLLELKDDLERDPSSFWLELFSELESEWDAEGYLCELFHASLRVGIGGMGTLWPPQQTRRGGNLNEPVIIRQVPGDGCCLFHAVAIRLNLIQGRHLRNGRRRKLEGTQVALCNVLERPIHAYELVASESNIDDGDTKRVGIPDITPGIDKENGNHFMAIFPVNTMRKHVNITRDEFHSETEAAS